VKNYSVDNMFSKIKSFEPFYTRTASSSDIYSDEGFFVIENSSGKLHKRVVEDVKTKRSHVVDGHELIVDESVETTCEAFQVPVDHIVIQTTTFFYKTNPKSNVQMVVVGTTANNATVQQHDTNRYDGFVPSDYYFDCVGDKGEDISVFLSLFN